jgi:hypothetical protein
MVNPIRWLSLTGANPISTSSAPSSMKRSGWPSAIWRTSHRCGSSRCSRMRVFPFGGASLNSSTYASVLSCDPIHWVNWPHATARGWWSISRTASRPCYHAQAGLQLPLSLDVKIPPPPAVCRSRSSARTTRPSYASHGRCSGTNCHRHRRGLPGQEAFPSRDGGTPPAQPLLQLQRQIQPRPQ